MSFRLWSAIILIVLGILFWLGKFDIISFYWSRDWPVVLIVIGLFSLVNYYARRLKKKNRTQRSVILRKLDNGEIDAEEAIRRLKDL
ncbi:hypothetical protein KAU13_05845 [candidate division WOR-3 bacterium]|nr:hypothetical protein [candidate division WOR-3 bacterium]TET78487.1 MAG: hypothetical protein E3J41_04465 [Candidatus Cloacimonadota bacterium]